MIRNWIAALPPGPQRWLLLVGLLAYAYGLALTNPAKVALNIRHGLAASPQPWALRIRPWAMALLCVVSGLGMLWWLCLNTPQLRAGGGLRVRAVEGQPGLLLLVAAQLAWLMLAGGVAMLAVWIKCGDNAISEPSAGPPAGI